LRIELQQVETRLARLAQEKTGVEAALADPATPGADFAELGRSLAHIAAETQALEERWLELNEALEALAAGG
jgi:ATP-binding cassette subfamily F protein 3